MASPRPTGAAAVKGLFPPPLVTCSVPLAVLLSLATPAAAQSPPFERIFPYPRAEVEKATVELHSTASGRLPILDGFVAKGDQPLDHYERGYYQCEVQVIAAAQGGTLVRVTAKITAWYRDPNLAQSGYRVLPSNGRLETDLLDRLDEALLRETGSSTSSPHQTPLHTEPNAAGSAPPQQTARNSPANHSAVLPSASPPSTPAPVVPRPREEPLAQAPTDGDLNSLKQRREQTEQRMEELSGDIQHLEEILQNQAHPADLAIVRKPGTPVMARPQAGAPTLFSADAEDEFPILENAGAWVQVQISGASRGWIRRADLDLPDGLAGNSKKAGASSSAHDAAFRVAREETNSFTGDWKPLHGKTVRILWIEPTSTVGKSPSARAKRDFAKSLFLNTYKEISSPGQTVAGIVVVFDTADGGQIAVTLETLKRWQGGSLSEDSFWQQCSIDPPELLENPAN
jgi:hypothetical protein